MKQIAESIEGAILILLHLCSPFLRKYRETWGATAAEHSDTYPDDALSAQPTFISTHGITINAPAEKVFPWLVQFSQDRGGMYSYVGLENLVGCKMPHVTHIEYRFQNLKLIKGMMMHPAIPLLPLHCYKDNSYLHYLGTGDPVKGLPGMSWVLMVKPLTSNSCRLLSHIRSTVYGNALARFANGPYLTGAISFVMERKSLLTLKKLSEK